MRKPIIWLFAVIKIHDINENFEQNAAHLNQTSHSTYLAVTLIHLHWSLQIWNIASQPPYVRCRLPLIMSKVSVLNYRSSSVVNFSYGEDINGYCRSHLTCYLCCVLINPASTVKSNSPSLCGLAQQIWTSNNNPLTWQVSKLQISAESKWRKCFRMFCFQKKVIVMHSMQTPNPWLPEAPAKPESKGYVVLLPDFYKSRSAYGGCIFQKHPLSAFSQFHICSTITLRTREIPRLSLISHNPQYSSISWLNANCLEVV